jgi:rare lipoprotein A
MSKQRLAAVAAVAFGIAAYGAVSAQTPPPAPAATPVPAAPAAAPAPAKTPAAAVAPSAGADRMDGLAAYYSNRLSGHKTASGKTYNPGALTGAHPTLPFGTKVKVTNTKNQKSVVVTINDRGPTQPDRVIDLSRAAASKLGMLHAGLVPVTLEVVSAAPAAKGKQ